MVMLTASLTVDAPNYWNSDTSLGVVPPARLLKESGRTTRELQAGVAQSDDENGIYYNWGNANWDFGNAMQYPLLKYTAATDVLDSPACRVGAGSVRVPRCEDLIAPRIRNGLRDLNLVSGELAPPLCGIGEGHRHCLFRECHRSQPDPPGADCDARRRDHQYLYRHRPK